MSCSPWDLKESGMPEPLTLLLKEREGKGISRLRFHPLGSPWEPFR